MSIFSKKKEPTPSCCTGQPAVKIESIKVLSSGCKCCKQQYQNVVDAAKELGIVNDVEYITDMEKVMEYGVMSMPAIVVNEKIVSVGQMLSVNEVRTLLEHME